MSVGFLGLGIMGAPMAANLLKKGTKVVVWNRDASKTGPLVAAGATAATTPAEVVRQCALTFAMLADPAACAEVVFGPGGVLESIRPGKDYVDFSTVDVGTSASISEAVTQRGGRFLEAPVGGSKKPAMDGQLVIMAAGSRELFDECGPHFSALAKATKFLGGVGNGARMKLCVNMIMGAQMAALAEGTALAKASGLAGSDLMDILDLGMLSSPLIKLKGPMLLADDYPTNFPLKHQQKDLRLAIALGDELGMSTPVAAAANEAYKRAKGLGMGDSDLAAVYRALAK